MFYAIKRYVVILIFIVVIIIGLFFFRSDQSMEADFESASVAEDTKLQLDKSESEKLEETETADVPTKLVVDVKGAIENPGVYELDVGTRVVDLIEVAGGFSPKALDAEINLAQKLTDEMVIYIPKQGEETETIGEAMSKNSKENDANKVKVNEASEEELTTLNGVGPSKAQAIIAYREEHGPFQHVDELLDISGIGEKTLEQFQDTIIVP